MAKLTQKQLSALRVDYLEKRKALLINRVDALGVRLFDQVFNSYLQHLENDNGALIRNEKNVNLVRGLDSVFKTFSMQYNIPVIQGWVSDMQGIVPLNDRYFKNIAQKGINTTADKAKAVTNKTLGVSENGLITEGGFADKFIKDQALLKKIKSQTLKALTSGMGFQDFRNALKTTIQGIPEEQLSGGLQQYYRNYAYDTYQKVDRLNQDVFAKELGLRYFIWQGGLKPTSRALCKLCNGKIVDSIALGHLTFEALKPSLRGGLDEDWVPVKDLGQWGCEHTKSYVPDSMVKSFPSKVLNINDLI